MLPTYTDVKKIVPNPENPRTISAHKFKKLVKSIQDFPQMLELRPIVVDENMVVLGGNMRLKACIEAGLQEVPIIKAEQLTEDQKKEFIVKDNVGFGEWDWDILANEWDADLLDSWGMDLPVVENPKPEVQEDNYEIPNKVTTDIKPGDLFQIGPHRLLCGDSTNPAHMEKLFQGDTAMLVVTDPPYNVDYQGSNGLKIMNDKMSDDKFYEFLWDAFSATNYHVSNGGAWYVFHSDSVGVQFRTALTDAGVELKQVLIWVKNSIVLGRQDYQWKHEPILYGWKPGAAHYFVPERTHPTVIQDPEIDLTTLKKSELIELIKAESTILQYDKPRRNDVHPTMKPINLLAHLIRNSSQKQDIITDPFLGSGSTMVACHQLERTCYGMELDPNYAQVIVERMHQLDPSLPITKNAIPWKPTKKQ